jgi:hypothetical protein
MKNAIICSLAAMFLGVQVLREQVENQSLKQSEHKKSIELPFEKVYLHLDRSYYSADDDIWIKAYLVDALTNKLSDNSNNLYIELISPESKIIKRLILRMDNGIGNGDIHLGDSIPSGNYLIRAYTSWMRNFGEVFFFKKEIVIENQIVLNASDRHDQEAGGDKVDVQFFPEGGPLIENVYTVMGFKAINSSGFGCDVKGYVFSSLGDTVANFASTHLGMGSLLFISKKGLKYFAVGSTANGTSFRVELPIASETGYSLKVSDINKDFFRVTIKTNQETIDKNPLRNLVITGTSHNSLCVTAKVEIKAINSPVVLPKKEFPEGVAAITLMDSTSKIYCERLYYVHSAENYHISIIPDNQTYSPRQKVTLQISVKDSSDKPVSANLSVSVVDGTQVRGFEKEPDISSCLLLESEIRSYIEQPFYYFDTTVPGRNQALDNLLLTQGWRNFVWNCLPDTAGKIINPAEKGIIVSGRLRHIWTNKPIANANISMALLGNDKPFYEFTQTDSAGKYRFNALSFTGRQNILLSSTDKRDNDKGMILLDSIFQDPAPVYFERLNKPGQKAKKVSDYINVPNPLEASENIEISTYNKEAMRKYNILKKYHITDTIQLNEVVVNARKPVNENADGHQRIYGEPDFSLTITDKMMSLHDPFQALQGRVASLFITGDNNHGYLFTMRGQKGTPLCLLDNNEVDMGTLLAFPMAAVDKIEVIKDAGELAFFGFRGSFGVISVLTKRGKNGPVIPVLSFINQPVYGYYQVRTFYAPKYNVPQSQNEKPDLRTTIHWEPNLVTNVDGNATVSFFNTDSKTTIKVDVEGIAEPGIPLTGRTSFDVK